MPIRLEQLRSTCWKLLPSFCCGGKPQKRGGREWVASVKGEQLTSLEAAFFYFESRIGWYFLHKNATEVSCVVGWHVAGFESDRLKIKRGCVKQPRGRSRELLAEPAATNHTDQLQCDKWMVLSPNLHPCPHPKHHLWALNQMDFQTSIQMYKKPRKL